MGRSTGTANPVSVSITSRSIAAYLAIAIAEAACTTEPVIAAALIVSSNDRSSSTDDTRPVDAASPARMVSVSILANASRHNCAAAASMSVGVECSVMTGRTRYVLRLNTDSSSSSSTSLRGSSIS